MSTPIASDEALLVRQARAGSTSAFGSLVGIYHGNVFGFLLTLTRQRQDAEDMTQETFLRAWKKFHRYDPQLPLLPWLLTLARRESIRVFRKSRPLPPDLDFMEQSPNPAPMPWLWDIARRELSPDSYSALWLHYREEIPLKAVAGILGKREGAVKVLLHRARKTLAVHLRAKPTEEEFDYPLATRQSPS